MTRVSWRDGIDIGDLWNTSNDSGSELDFLVGLDHIENAGPVLGEMTDESLHVSVVVLWSNVAFGVDKSQNVSFGLGKILNGGHDAVYKIIKNLIFIILKLFIMEKRVMESTTYE